MLVWSKFNEVCEAGSKGLLIFNIGSGSLIHIDRNNAGIIPQVQANPNMDFSSYPSLYFNLRIGGFLVDENADFDFVRSIRSIRAIANQDESLLLLTIAPTQECNFACEYCYEQNRIPSYMSQSTEDSIVKFIKTHKAIKAIKVLWYGGEPLLCFDKIKSLTKKIALLGKSYDSQLITNGYCLTNELIKTLDEVKITHIQITIDGLQKTHDSRRYLVNGEPTYNKIIENIDNLMHSEWRGSLNVRVNIDKKNSSDFVSVYRFFEIRYPEQFGSHMRVYPGFVDNPERPDRSHYFLSEDKARFLIKLSQDFHIAPLVAFPRVTTGGCTMTKKNAYVVGPQGELYKCWRDLGNSDYVIGTVADNPEQFTSYTNDIELLTNEKSCERCTFFPVCDGGCPKIKIFNRRNSISAGDTCTHFKHSIHELLRERFKKIDVNV